MLLNPEQLFWPLSIRIETEADSLEGQLLIMLIKDWTDIKFCLKLVNSEGQYDLNHVQKYKQN